MGADYVLFMGPRFPKGSSRVLPESAGTKETLEKKWKKGGSVLIYFLFICVYIFQRGCKLSSIFFLNFLVFDFLWCPFSSVVEGLLLPLLPLSRAFLSLSKLEWKFPPVSIRFRSVFFFRSLVQLTFSVCVNLPHFSFIATGNSDF